MNYLSLLEEISKYKAKLLCVSKNRSISEIKEIKEMGCKDFAENRINEINSKIEVFNNTNLSFIGHIQSNKVMKIISVVDEIQSVDRLKIASLIAENTKKELSVLLQYKASKEESKTGFKDIDDIFKVIDILKENPYIKINGLMSMAENTDDSNIVEQCFKKTYNIFNQIQKQYSDFKILSMGMSSDYKIALDCGSNLVRIGSLIFKGER